MSDERVEITFGGKPTAGKIFHIKSRSYPEFHFEYHPATKRCYVVPVGQVVFKDGQPFHEAQLLAENVESIMRFKGIVTGFIQGYKLGQQIQPRLVVK